MRRGVVCGVLAFLLSATLGVANQFGVRVLSVDEIEHEARLNDELDAYIERHGLPDLAEMKDLGVGLPWDTYEVTLYYLGSRKEIAFARAHVLGRPDVHLTRYERDLTDADLHALMATVAAGTTAHPIVPVAAADGTPAADFEPVAPTPHAADHPVSRAEAAALRATQAAERVEKAAVEAERAATRAERAFDRLAAIMERR